MWLYTFSLFFSSSSSFTVFKAVFLFPLSWTRILSLSLYPPTSITHRCRQSLTGTSGFRPCFSMFFLSLIVSLKKRIRVQIARGPLLSCRVMTITVFHFPSLQADDQHFNIWYSFKPPVFYLCWLRATTRGPRYVTQLSIKCLEHRQQRCCGVSDAVELDPSPGSTVEMKWNDSRVLARRVSTVSSVLPQQKNGWTDG